MGVISGLGLRVECGCSGRSSTAALGLEMEAECGGTEQGSRCLGVQVTLGNS